jgi:hypothetical protein
VMTRGAYSVVVRSPATTLTTATMMAVFM